MASHLNAVLVANAGPLVKQRARELVEAGALEETLYVARGGLFCMNGNYAAGVLEGAVHFMPETRGYMRLENEADSQTP